MVTMPMLSLSMAWSGFERIDGGNRSADDDGLEAADFRKVLRAIGQRLAASWRSSNCRSAWTRRLGNHDEHRQVDGVDAFAQDRALAAALAEAGVGAIAGQKTAARLGNCCRRRLAPSVWLEGSG